MPLHQFALTNRLDNKQETVYVDEQDKDRMQGITWGLFLKKNKNTGLTPKYVYGIVMGKRTLLHHFIAGRAPGKMVIDHMNGNSLDNRRCNL